MTAPGSEALRELALATADLQTTWNATGLLRDPSGVGDHLGCSETDALERLFRALGCTQLADQLLEQHRDSESPDDISCWHHPELPHEGRADDDTPDQGTPDRDAAAQVPGGVDSREVEAVVSEAQPAHQEGREGEPRAIPAPRVLQVMPAGPWHLRRLIKAGPLRGQSSTRRFPAFALVEDNDGPYLLPMDEDGLVLDPETWVEHDEDDE